MPRLARTVNPPAQRAQGATRGKNEPASAQAKRPRMPRQPRKLLRTFHADQHRPGRFRPETVERTPREPVKASIGERVIARQLDGLDEHRDNAE